MKANISIGILTFLIVLALSAWTIKTINKLQPNRHDALKNPDAIVNDVEHVSINAQGRVINKLLAPKVTHFNNGDVSEFNQPRFIIYNLNKSFWVITANQGTSFRGSDKLLLQDHVKVELHTIDGNMVLTTSTLTVWPKRKYAQTHQAVTIKRSKGVVHAVGLTANLQTGDINLLSNVRGHDEPQT